MIRKNFPLFLLFLIFLIAILHFLATSFYWYWSIWWFDIPMHFLGGAWVAGVSLWLYFLSDYFKKNPVNKKKIFLIAILTAGLIGFLWEVFEFSLSQLVVFNSLNSWMDTFSDFIMDILGAVGAALYFIVYKLPLLNCKIKKYDKS